MLNKIKEYVQPNRNCKTGDTIQLGWKIDEGKNERVQYFNSLLIKKNSGILKTITIRGIIQGVGVECVIPLYSPKIFSMDVKSSSLVKRSKLYFTRNIPDKISSLD
jgi:large subunit ribosomal protein L19